MPFFGNIFRSSKPEIYLALDIGTEVAKALVFTIDSQQKKGVVIGVGKQPQKKGNMQSGTVSDILGTITT